MEKHAGRSFSKREDAIVVLGRISSEKNYEEVVNAVARTKSKPVVRMIGSLTRSGRAYLKKIMELAKIKHVNVEIYPNAPRDVLEDLLGKSKLYVHAARGEHFGIAVVEAMAAGLPVIVHRSGGQYYDIIGEGAFGLHYKEVEELANLIDILIANESLWNKYHELSRRRALDFSEEVFENTLNRLINKLCVHAF